MTAVSYAQTTVSGNVTDDTGEPVIGASVMMPKWLSDAVFYQIYPSSYMDTDGNGIGDLPGITSKLDYIKSIGVNALWLNPIFESGWFDGGYDVIDYYKVDPRFGTNSDLVTLVTEAHKRGIKVCLDLVAGHTSSECAWFKASAEKDANGRYSDYFIWLDNISDAEKQEIAARKQEPDPAVLNTTRRISSSANQHSTMVSPIQILIILGSRAWMPLALRLSAGRCVISCRSGSTRASMASA